MLVPFAVVTLAVALRLGWLWLQRHRLAAELRSDWWPRFEQEFQTYASRAWEAARRAERRA